MVEDECWMMGAGWLVVDDGWWTMNDWRWTMDDGGLMIEGV